jgi:hypothetical protein
MSTLTSIVTNFGGPTGHFHEDYFWNGMNALPRFRQKAGLDNFFGNGQIKRGRARAASSVDNHAKVARTT